MSQFDVKTSYNAAFKTFVEFAQKTHADGYDSANAKATLAGRKLTVSAMSLYETSNVFRTKSEDSINDNTRELFKKAVCDMFGGEAKIPANVKKALLLSDYGKGRPLTARRIMAVKAEVDSVLKQHATFNEGIFSKVSSGNIAKLPQDMKDALAQLTNFLRDIFGEEAVPQGAKITDIVYKSYVVDDIKALRDAANVQGKDLTKDQIVSLFAARAFDRLASSAVGNVLLARAAERNSGVNYTAVAMGSQFFKANPDVRDEIRNCKNPQEIQAVLARCDAKMNAFLDLAERCVAHQATVVPQAVAELSEQLGLDRRIIAAHIPLDVLKTKAGRLTSAISSGGAPGCREPGYDMKAAYDALVNKFVQARIDVYRAVDNLALPENQKNLWKAEFISFHSIPPITPAQLLEVAASFDAKKLLSVLSKGLPPSVAGTVLDNITNSVMDRIKAVTGNEQFFADLGSEEIIALFNMILSVAKHDNPAIADSVANVRDWLLGPVSKYCETEKLSYTATLAKVLGDNDEMEIMSEPKYLDAVCEATQAALDECEIIDADVRSIVMERMRERASADFVLATSLQALSDALATVKERATLIAREFIPAPPEHLG